MIITIEADSILDLLAPDECLVPAVEDLLLDSIIEWRDTPKTLYTPQAQITYRDDLNVKITISAETAITLLRNGNNGKE